MITVDSARLPRANVTAGGIRARIVAIRPAIAGTRGRAVALEAAVVGTSEAAIVRVMARRSTLVAATRVTGMCRLRAHEIAPITTILIAICGVRAAVLPVNAVHRMVAATTRNRGGKKRKDCAKRKHGVGFELSRDVRSIDAIHGGHDGDDTPEGVFGQTRRGSLAAFSKQPTLRREKSMPDCDWLPANGLAHGSRRDFGFGR